MVLLTKAGTFRGLGSSKFMTDKLNRFWPLIASVAFAALLAANAAQSAATLKEANPASSSDQTAEQMFADAPDGGKLTLDAVGRASPFGHTVR